MHLEVIEPGTYRVEYRTAEVAQRKVQNVGYDAAVPVRAKVLCAVGLCVVVVQHQQHLDVDQEEHSEGGECTAELYAAHFLTGTLRTTHNIEHEPKLFRYGTQNRSNYFSQL